MIDLTPVFEALISILLTVAMLYLVPCLRRKISAEDMDDLLAWVEIAVAAAQQLYHQANGEKRLQYALGILADKGFDINDKAVRSAVEAAVLELHHKLEVS